MRPADLPQAWRERAAFLRRYAPAVADAFEDVAAELETALRAAEDEPLTLSEAARESGYSVRRLRELIAKGQLPNAGRRGAPRIRRGDLPRRARAAGGYDAREDALELMRAVS